jgi:hypothetical protein
VYVVCVVEGASCRKIGESVDVRAPAAIPINDVTPEPEQHLLRDTIINDSGSSITAMQIPSKKDASSQTSSWFKLCDCSNSSSSSGFLATIQFCFGILPSIFGFTVILQMDKVMVGQ